MTHDAISKFLARGRVRALRNSFSSPVSGTEPRFRVVIVGGGVAAQADVAAGGVAHLAAVAS